MKKIIVIFMLLINTIYASEILKQKNILTIKNLIAKEEAIAFEFQRYLLNELEIPSLNDLISNEYLGENFSLSTSMGNNIEFKSVNDLQLKTSIANPNLDNSYKKLLYKRELYRNYTTVNWESNYNSSFVSINLSTDEAKNIFSLLKNGNSIASDCTLVVGNNYCLASKITIRWYNNDRTKWIEYNIKDLSNGDIAISDISFVDNLDPKLSELPIGTKIYIKDSGIKLKISANEYMDVDL